MTYQVYFCNEGEHNLEPLFMSRETYYECTKCPHYEVLYTECDGL